MVAPTRELCIQISDVLGLILRRFVWLVRPVLPPEALARRIPFMHVRLLRKAL